MISSLDFVGTFCILLTTPRSSESGVFMHGGTAMLSSFDSKREMWIVHCSWLGMVRSWQVRHESSAVCGGYFSLLPVISFFLFRRHLRMLLTTTRSSESQAFMHGGIGDFVSS